MGIIETISDFGAIDAENDDRLFDYFIQSESLKRIRDEKRRVVIGRKGSGKTAIYKFLSKEAKNKLTAALLFRDYPWKVHDRFANDMVSDRETYVNSWDFLIYVELAKLLVEDIDNYGFFQKFKVRKIQKWLKRSWGSVRFNHRETMNPKNWDFSFSPSVMGNSLGSVSRGESAQRLGSTLGEINKKLLSNLIPLLQNDRQYILLFDELDLSYDPNDANYLSRIKGLLLSAYSINSYFQIHNDNVKVYIFLRSDIYEILDFQDKNKITDNHVEYLNWDPKDENANLSLKKLAAKRIQENIKQADESFSYNWGKIFEPANIGRNQLKWNFISDQTFLRPRDLIKLLNLSLEEAQKRLRLGPGSQDAIINRDIHNVRKDYSDYLYSELKDEVGAKYKDFDSYLEVLRDMHKTVFTIENYEASFEVCAVRLKMQENSSTVLERMYEFSVVGFYKPGGGGYGGATYCFRYTDPKIKFNPKASNYKVHPGFKEYLELIDG
ncbi:P-loop ATPase, Sll1717 family [Paenibacillus sp. CAU 1782]